MNFESMVEQDVREDIVTPLLHRLGYAKGTKHDIKREHYLVIRYDREYLGRKNRKADPKLTGKADYILEIEGKVRWVIEAKAPANPIVLDDIEQAYSYAKHPEVRAPLFVICNGVELQIFRTDRSPKSAHVATFTYEELMSRSQELHNILSPTSILRTYPEIEIDIGVPLGLGLRSTAQITGGFFRYTSATPPVPFIDDMRFTISGGIVLRENGRLSGTITTQSPSESGQRLSEQIGTHIIEFRSDDTDISTDSARPTRLVSHSAFTFPRGATVMGHTFQTAIEFTSTTVVEGYLEGQIFNGRLSLEMSGSIPGSSVRSVGEFQVHLN